MKSNKIIEEELKGEDPDYRLYIKENYEIIMRTKDDVIKIINAFLKSGINLQKEVYPQLKYRSLYLDENGESTLEESMRQEEEELKKIYDSESTTEKKDNQQLQRQPDSEEIYL